MGTLYLYNTYPSDSPPLEPGKLNKFKNKISFFVRKLFDFDYLLRFEKPFQFRKSINDVFLLSNWIKYTLYSRNKNWNKKQNIFRCSNSKMYPIWIFLYDNCFSHTFKKSGPSSGDMVLAIWFDSSTYPFNLSIRILIELEINIFKSLNVFFPEISVFNKTYSSSSAFNSASN